MNDIGNRVYFVEMIGHELMKIGTAACSITRVRSLRSWSPYELRLIAEAPGSELTEAMAHDRFRDLRFRNEWFRVNPVLRAFAERVRLDGAFPFSDMPDESGQPRTMQMIGASSALAKIGVSLPEFARHVGQSPSSMGNWLSRTSLPVRYAPIILRMAQERGFFDITPRDLFAAPAVQLRAVA